LRFESADVVGVAFTADDKTSTCTISERQPIVPDWPV
jgi:hypothetical protein